MKTSTHTPLIVHVPWFKNGKSLSMVEFVDIYPTLCELCNLPAPPQNQLDGKSFVPILKNPKTKTKSSVFIQWQSGYSIVNKRYSYAEWEKEDGKTSVMIFDHKIDPKENKNQVNEYHYKNLLMKFSKYIKLKTSQIVSYKSAPN